MATMKWKPFKTRTSVVDIPGTRAAAFAYLRSRPLFKRHAAPLGPPADFPEHN
jgi:hypothetical protein